MSSKLTLTTTFRLYFKFQISAYHHHLLFTHISAPHFVSLSYSLFLLFMQQSVWCSAFLYSFVVNCIGLDRDREHESLLLGFCLVVVCRFFLDLLFFFLFFFRCFSFSFSASAFSAFSVSFPFFFFSEWPWPVIRNEPKAGYDMI
jgi:hypothetical protein